MINGNKKYFLLSKDCQLVKGASRSLICDLTRSKFYIIPNSLYSILAKGIINFNKLYFELVNQKEILDEYFDFLIKNELIIFDSDKFFLKRLGNIKFDFLVPSKVTTLIFQESAKNLITPNLIKTLNNLGCQNIEIRVKHERTLNDIKLIFLNSIILNIELLIDHSKFKNINVKKIILTESKIRKVTVFNFTRDYYEMDTASGCAIYYTQQNIDSVKSCGNISPNYFYTNINLYTESQTYNTCLNCKVSIDEKGEIRNCPSSKRTFGNIKNINLEKAVGNQKFKQLWKIKKDDIKTCQVCEFRHICSDCRAFLEDPKDIYSKPLKCGYDPYTGTWSDWAKNPLKQKAINHYGL